MQNQFLCKLRCFITIYAWRKIEPKLCLWSKITDIMYAHKFSILAMFCSYIHGSFHIQGSFHNKFNIFFGSFDIHTSFDIHRSVHNHAHSSGINTCQSIRPIILLCKPSLVRPSPLHTNPGKESTFIKHNVKNIFGHCLFGVPGLNACLGLKNLDLVNIVNFFTCRL